MVEQLEGATDEGAAAIIKVMLRNPFAAVQLFIFFGSMFTLYYALTNEINAGRAQEVQDRKETVRDVADAKSETARVASTVSTLDARSATQYGEMQTSLTAHSTQLTRIELEMSKVATNLEWLMRRLDADNGQSSPRTAH